MGLGLQCFDDAGNVIFNTDYRTGTVLGATTTGAVNGSTNVGVPISWVAMLPADPVSTDPYANLALPSLFISGTVISWNYPSGPVTNRNMTIIYGNA